MLFQSKRLVGLDIGASSIKLVEVEIARKNVTLTSFGFIPTPPGAIVSGEIADAVALSEAVRQLVMQTKTKRKKACTAVWGTGVITKKITLPKIEEKILAEQLRWEAEQYIPFDINEIALEYQVLKGGDASSEQMNVLLVGAKRDLVLRYAEVLEAAGLEASIVDVSGFAMANCYFANYGESKGQNAILLDLGANITNFVVVESGDVTFSRDIPVGGSTYTSDIQKALGVSLAEAEALKISAGTGQPVPQEVTAALRQTNEAVADEIKRSFDFYMATGAQTMQKVYVSGGGLGIPGLFEQIQSTLNIPLESLNPFLKVQYDSKHFKNDYIAQISPYACVGLGLALREVGDR